MSNYVQLKVGDVDKAKLQLGSERYIQGAPGEDGFSPTVEVEEVEGAAASGILLEDDASGKWLLEDGSGADGDIVLADESGKLYHIPAGNAAGGEVAVTDDSGNTWHIPINEAARNGHKITVTDKDGEHVFYVWDGRDGSGSGGGGSGEDGFSPTVDITPITGGNRITITDKNGTHTIDVMNGQNGQNGAPGAPGAPGSPGEDGKSAYESAVDGGYNGTEAQFNSDLAGIGNKQPKITASGILKGDGAGGVSAATAGTDYLAPNALTHYRTAAAQDVIDAGKEAAGLGLTGASVGDLVRVNAVDSNGKPTSWKHVPLNEIKCNKNLLDNWYFVGGGSQQGDGVFPINQRGQTTYTNVGYGIDRFKVVTSHQIDVTNTGIKITVSANANLSLALVQQIEAPPVGTKMSFSALVVQNSLTNGAYFRYGSNAGLSDSQISGIGLFSFSFVVTNKMLNNFQVGFSVIKGVDNGNSITISAVKLELGSEQTLAHNEGTEENPVWVLNEIPDYGEELRKCQRYLQRINIEWPVITGTSSRITYSVILNTPMAKNPTLIQHNTLEWYRYYSGTHIDNITSQTWSLLSGTPDHAIVSIDCGNKNPTSHMIGYASAINVLLSAEA